MEPDLSARIRSFITRQETGDFNTLAVALFRRQYELNQPYRRYIDNGDVDAVSVDNWRDIPAAPAQAFKVFDLTCVPTWDCAAVFHSSGTTQALAGKHWMDSDALQLYQLSVVQGFRAIESLYSYPQSIDALMPPPDEAPHSSLTHMLKTLHARRWHWYAGNDWTKLTMLMRAEAEPYILFGTGFAFASLFEQFPDKVFDFPTGGMLINTGGFKGRTREVDRGEFYAAMREKFGVPDSACISEYGMSEMASQFWAVGEHGAYTAPHWLRLRVIDPESGDDAAYGEPGLLRVYDLANWNSVLAIQTQDMVREVDRGFVFIGRAPNADVRGCSLTVEDLWNRQ